MRKEQRTTNFPGEMISEILLRLPPKSLVRFGCVCKYWESLVASPGFMRSHLDEFIQLRQVSLMQHDDKRLLKLSTGSPDGELSDIDLGPLFLTGADRFEWVGSYNGVLCIAVIFQNDHGRRTIQLCNPSINESIMLPKSVLQVSKVGFGFNPHSGRVDDFVVTNMKTFADVDHTGNTESFPVVDMCGLRLSLLQIIHETFTSFY